MGRERNARMSSRSVMRIALIPEYTQIQRIRNIYCLSRDYQRIEGSHISLIVEPHHILVSEMDFGNWDTVVAAIHSVQDNSLVLLTRKRMYKNAQTLVPETTQTTQTFIAKTVLSRAHKETKIMRLSQIIEHK